MSERIKIPSLRDLHMKIMDYPDIQALLNEYLDRCKANDKRLSRRYFNEVAFGKSTPGYLQSILGKKYKFSDDIVERLTELIQTNNEESEYLYILTRLWNMETGFQLTSAALMNMEQDFPAPKLLKKLSKLQGKVFLSKEELVKAAANALKHDWDPDMEASILKHMEVEGRQSTLYKCLHNRYEKLRSGNVHAIHLTSWGHLVIFRLIKLLLNTETDPKKLLSPEFIRNKLDPYIMITPAEVRKCLADLQSEGVVFKTEKGVQINEDWKIADDFLWVKKFHRDVLQQAAISLDTPVQEREYQSIFIATTPEKLTEIKQMIDQQKTELRRSTASEKPEMLVSVSWQMFPVTAVDSNPSGERA